MIFKTRAEGVRYFLSAWNSVGIAVVLYFILWFGWLVLPVISLFRNKAIK